MQNDDALSSSVAAQRAAQLNSQTRVLDTYGGHRDRVMSLILGASEVREHSPEAGHGRGYSLTVLGAGNCRDLDLVRLSSAFSEIRLVDLDQNALDSGLREQAMNDRPERRLSDFVQTFGPVDLASPLATVCSEDFSDHAKVRDLCEKLSSPFAVPPVPKSDIVVSACVLSQMILTLVNSVTEQHAEFLTLLQALRRGHFARMLQLMTPGGRGLFISDVVSSETLAELLSTNEKELPRLLASCFQKGNFFSGLNPGVVCQELQTVPRLVSNATDVRVHAPWLWIMGPRTYAVYAVSFRKTAE